MPIDIPDPSLPTYTVFLWLREDGQWCWRINGEFGHDSDRAVAVDSIAELLTA